jgi:hypothetical protein
MGRDAPVPAGAVGAGRAGALGALGSVGDGAGFFSSHPRERATDAAATMASVWFTGFL